MRKTVFDRGMGRVGDIIWVRDWGDEKVKVLCDE